jgi:hypothetical protein
MRRYIPLVLASSLSAFTLEYYQLYKDVDVMRMGGANVGLGGSGSAIFYNPAGLSRIKHEDGADVKILNVSATANTDAMNLVEDGLDIQDIKDDREKNLALIQLIRDHLGEVNHFEGSNFSYIAKQMRNIGFSIGVLANAALDVQTHKGFGSYGLIDLQGIAAGGIVGGLSYNYSSKLSVGVGAKYLRYGTIEERYTLGELLLHKDDIEGYIENDIEYGNKIVFDFGLLYRYKNVDIGFSGVNLGGIGKEEYRSYIPGTYNIGVGYRKKFKKKYLKEAKIGLDYIDITGEYRESDRMKKIRAGVDMMFIDNKYFTVKAGAGVYQGYYTAGVSLRATIVEVNFVTYGEEIGGYSGQDEDRRYLLNVKVGW